MDGPERDIEINNINNESIDSSDTVINASPLMKEIDQKIENSNVGISIDAEMNQSSSTSTALDANNHETFVLKSAKKSSLMSKFKSNKLEPIEVVNVKQKNKTRTTMKSTKTKAVESIEMNEQGAEDSNKKEKAKNNSTKPNRIIFAASQTPGQSLIPIEYSSNTKSLSNSNSDNNFTKAGVTFEVFWHNLTYFHPKTSTVRHKKDSIKKRTIEKNVNGRPTLCNISGSFQSHQMTALLGPSGAGKTVFLNYLAGFIDVGDNVKNTGQIYINGVESVRIGFVEQFDNLLPYLTVYETLLFASRIRNTAKVCLNHSKIVKNVIQRLDLTNVVNVQVIRCSNGQRKRISIGIELVFNSDILILDEPTTGLDTVSSHQIIEILKNLIQRRSGMAVVATIHQPSSAMFELFDNLIVLSCEGTIIYQGSPFDLHQTLSLVGLSTPKFSNMTDFLLEVASGDFGRQSLHLLMHYNREYTRSRFNDEIDDVKACLLNNAKRKAHQTDKRSFLFCTWLMFVRQVVSNVRNRLLNILRLVTAIIISCFLGTIFTDVVGSVSTCSPSKYVLWTIEVSSLMEYFEKQKMHSQENLAVIFILSLTSLFVSMLKVAVVFPQEVRVFRREYNNFNYNMLSYFISIILGDVPFDLPTTAIFTVIVHRLTGQIFNNWERLFLVVLPCCLITFIGQLIGMILGVLFHENLFASIYSLNIIIIPIMLFSGFFKLTKNMSEIMLYCSYISFMKPTVNAIMIALYGLGRCEYEMSVDYNKLFKGNDSSMLTRPDWINSLTTLIEYQATLIDSQEEFVQILKNKTLDQENKLTYYIGFKSGNENKPFVLDHFNLDDDKHAYWHEIDNLFIYILIFIAILLITIYFKIKRRV